MVRDVNIDSVAFDRSAAVFRNVSMSIDYNYASVRNDTRIYCNGTSGVAAVPVAVPLPQPPLQ